MPRKGDIRFVPNQTASVGKTLYPLESIPDEIKTEVEEMYETLKVNPAGRLHVEYDTRGELIEYVNMVTSYCEQRPGGAIRFRKSPTRGLKEGAMDFRITDVLPEREERALQAQEAKEAKETEHWPAVLTTEAKNEVAEVLEPSGRRKR